MTQTHILVTNFDCFGTFTMFSIEDSVTLTWKVTPKFKGSFQTFVSYDNQQSFSLLGITEVNGEDKQYGFVSFELNHISDGSTFVKIPLVENHNSPMYHVLEYIKVSY
jgi:hypothetical protein